MTPLNTPEWLTLQRNAAQEAFNDTPVPPRGLHLWRYTDPKEFLNQQSGETPVTPVSKDLLSRKMGEHASALAIDNAGREILVQLSDDLQKQGVIITPLSKAVTEYQAIVEKHLYTLVNASTGKFEALNGAKWQDGIFIYIPKGKMIEKPIELLRAASASGNTYPRLLVVTEENVECTIVDEYVGGSTDIDGAHSQSNAAVEIFGGQNSRIRYVQLQQQEAGGNLYLTHRARIERDANMLTLPFSFGSAVSKQNFGVMLNGPGSESNMIGLLFGTGYQHFDNHTLHHHTSGQTKSNIDFKVVLRDKALSAYTGLIRIEMGARTCEAYQENRNLLLNPGTKAETIPELEILNEDVKCTHGAAIGPIDPMQVYYLRARGIEEPEATRMIVAGFVESTLKLMPKDLHDRISELVEAKLERL